METAAERVQFALQFAQMNLDTLSRGQGLTLREDLEDFLRCRPGKQYRCDPGDVIAAPLAMLTPPLPQEYPKDALRQLQQETHAIFSRLVDSRNAWAKDISQGWVSISGEYYLNSFPDVGKRSSNHLLMKGTTRDVFLKILIDLLKYEPTDRILRCPECRTIFYRIRKQQYCSRRCTNRANVRQWRQDEAVKEREQAQAHARYAKKEAPSGAKVKRRPRKRSTGHAETPRES
jgi:hypothetical protein